MSKSPHCSVLSTHYSVLLSDHPIRLRQDIGRNPDHFGFSIVDFRLSVNRRLRTAFRFPIIGKRRARFDKNFPQVCKQTKIGNRKSKLANYPVCSREDVWRNIETDLIRCVQVDDEFKLYRLLYRQVRRLGAFEYFVDVNSSAPK